MEKYTVAFHGIAAHSETAARSMLRLLLPLLGDRWRLADSASSDVVILAAESFEELNQAGAARPAALYVVLDDADTPPTNAFCVMARPLNSARTIEVLHKAQAELERRSGAMGATTTVPHAGFGADSSQRGIHTSMRTAVRWVLQDSVEAVTIVNLKNDKLFSVLASRGYTTRLRSSDLADLIRKNETVKLLQLTQEEQEQLVARKRTFEPLKQLEWIYWLAGSNGELRPGLHVSKPYRLRNWPDFSQLPHFRADVRMASLLRAEALTVGELAARAEVRLETACNFVNACAALGMLGVLPSGKAGRSARDPQPTATHASAAPAAKSARPPSVLAGTFGLSARSSGA